LVLVLCRWCCAGGVDVGVGVGVGVVPLVLVLCRCRWCCAVAVGVVPLPLVCPASHPSSVSACFCCSSGSGDPLIKRFGLFLLIVWLTRATHQAFRPVFAYRLALYQPVGPHITRFSRFSRNERSQPAGHYAFWAFFA
jgi:hypothetical protein